MGRLLIVAALAAGLSSPSCALARGKLVLVAIGGTSLADVASLELSNISRLIERGAVGVMNARPAAGRVEEGEPAVAGYSTEASCATMGAGTRAAGTVDAREAYSPGELVEGRTARDLYFSFYGSPPGQAEVLHLGINRVRYINSEARYVIEPGALGGALRRAGLRTAAIGNSDTPPHPRREIALVAADERGIIDYGSVGPPLVSRDPTAPYGVRTDSRRLVAEFRRVLARADFIVVDTGDTSRAASYSQHCLEEQGTRLRLDALRQADWIIGEIVQSLALSRDRILVVSTNPSARSVEESDFLPPVVAAGRGVGRGLLISGSTRRPGIITNTDIPVWILDFFAVPPPNSFVGRSVSTTRGSLPELIDINQNIVLQIARRPVTRGLSTFLIVYVIVISLYVLRTGHAPQPWVAWAALLPAALLLSVLWLPAAANPGAAGTAVALTGLTGAVLFAAWLVVRSPWRALAWMCGALILTVLLDLARGAVLLRNSLLSYTPVDGARYYGIGNEHMGSAIGAVMIGGGFLASALSGSKRLRMPVLAALLGIVVVAIGLPSHGANAGGAMAGAAAAAVGLGMWIGHPIGRKHIAAAVVSVIAALGLLLALDMLRPGGAQSHVARAAAAVANGGPGEMLSIIERKAAMNLMLLRHSAWSKLLLASVAAVIAMFTARHVDALARLKSNRPMHCAVIAAAVGALAALVLNDSGVVAAATAFIYVWTTVVLVALPVGGKGK